MEKIGETEDNKKILAGFIYTRSTGKAFECVPPNLEKIETITKALEDHCKPENSKVIAGKIMALKADRANLTDFAKRAEQLCESFQRSLVLEGSSRDKAIELTIDKTIDLCKANTTSTAVKSMLASYKFTDANEVIAKYTIETRNAVTDNQILHFRSNNRGRNNYHRNSRNNNNFRNNDFSNNFRGYNYNSNNNGWNGNNQIYHNTNQNNGNNRNRSYNNAGGNSRGNFNRNGKRYNTYAMHQSGNDAAPPPGVNQIRMNRADE